MEKKSLSKNNSVKKNILQKKVAPVKKSPAKVIAKENRTEKILVENFIALQKVIVNMVDKFGKMGAHIEKLLNLFEASAEALAKKEFDYSKEEKDNKKILEKIDNVLDQNKTIARSLALMHEVTHGAEIEEELQANPPRQQPPAQNQMPNIPQVRAPPMQQRPMIPPQQNFPKLPTMQPQMQNPNQMFQPKPNLEQTSSPSIEEYQESISSPTSMQQKPAMPKMNEPYGENEYAQ